MKMKSICLSVAALAILVMGSGPVWASGIISLNFSENSSNQIFAGNQLIGPVKTNSSNWNMSDNPTTGTLATGTKNNLIDDSGVATGVNASWKSSVVYYNHDGTGNDEQKLSVGYLDDGETSPGAGLSVIFTNIPYSRYRVYGLFATDQNQGNTPPTVFSRNYTVNGTWVYSGDASTYAVCYGTITNNMAANGAWWTQSVVGAVAGNYWMIETSGSTLTISGLPRSGDARGTLSAVIIEASQNLMAHNPDPSDGSTLVPLNKVLSWDAASDPNVPGQADPKITAHQVYLSNGTNDPNLFLVDTIAVTNPQVRFSYTPATPLMRDNSYLWRVDEVAGSATIKGLTWAFSTVSTSPALTSGIPADLMVSPSETATFTVEAMNPYTFDATGLTYAWYKVGNATVLSTTDTLVIPSAQGTDNGNYFCTVTLTSNGKTADSRTASLVVKQLVGHWPFDGNLNDVVGTNHGTAVGSPNLTAEGKVGSNSVRTSDGNYLYVPWNPTPSFTVSFWVLPESNAGNDYIIGCGNPSGAENFFARMTAATTYDVAFNNGATRFSYLTFPTTWNHEVFTYHHTTNTAKWYFNGALVGTVSGLTLNQPIDPFIYVGNRKNGQRRYTGKIDDLILYNYPLDALEVGKLLAQSTGSTYCLQSIPNDLNGDCRVDFGDFALLASNWLECNLAPESNCP